jgi:hypothetical protein
MKTGPEGWRTPWSPHEGHMLNPLNQFGGIEIVSPTLTVQRRAA